MIPRVEHDDVMVSIIKFLDEISNLPKLLRPPSKETYKVRINCRACTMISYNNEKDFWGHQTIFNKVFDFFKSFYIHSCNEHLRRLVVFVKKLFYLDLYIVPALIT